MLILTSFTSSSDLFISVIPVEYFSITQSDIMQAILLACTTQADSIRSRIVSSYYLLVLD